MSDVAYDFKIDPTKKVNEGCLPLYSIAANRYMLVKNGGGAFDRGKIRKIAGIEQQKIKSAVSDTPNGNALFVYA